MTAWGQVVEVGPPLLVRIAGDTADVAIGWQNDDISFSTGDKVALLKIGAQWVVAFRMGAA